jgi:hypothetical protein
MILFFMERWKRSGRVKTTDVPTDDESSQPQIFIEFKLYYSFLSVIIV